MIETEAGKAVDAFWIRPQDVGQFSSFARCPIKHNYHTHPMLQLNQLKQLAIYLMPHEKCRFAAGDLVLDSVFNHASSDQKGRSLEQVLATIEAPGSWLALYNVETQPEYKALLESIIKSVEYLIEGEQGKVLEVQGFVFISSPPAFTPFHIDRENNFWLQLAGQKHLSLFDHTDPLVADPRAVEDFIVTKTLKNLKLTDAIKSKRSEYLSRPGDGIYFPATTPHMAETTTEWVSAGNATSISIGVVFYTEMTRRIARIHQLNYTLRKLGMRPVSLQASGPIGLLKSWLGAASVRLRTLYNGYKPPPWSA